MMDNSKYKERVDWYHRYLMNTMGLGGGGSDSRYQAVLARADALTYTRPTSQETAQNALSASFTSAGIYDIHDVIHIFAVNNTNVANFSRINWKTPTAFQATNFSTPTFEAGGWNAGAGTAGLSSQFSPATSGTTWVDASSVSISAWIAAYPSSGDYIASTGAGTARNVLYRSSATVTGAVLHETPEGTITVTTGAQAAYDFITYTVYGGNRYLLKNGSLIATRAATLNASDNTLAIHYMRSLHTGHPNNMVLAGAMIGGGVTLAQHTAMYNSLTTYKTAIGL